MNGSDMISYLKVAMRSVERAILLTNVTC